MITVFISFSIFCENDEKEKVFLLSGSDKKVHLFKEVLSFLFYQAVIFISNIFSD